MDKDKLEALKYRQLQRLAKERGVKANLPKAALVEAIVSAGTATADVEGNDEETAMNETFEVKDSFLSTDSSPKKASGTEERFAQFFKDDDPALTPRGSSKPRQYLPASGQRTSSVLTIPSSSPARGDVASDKRTGSFLSPTASSIARSRMKTASPALRSSVVGTAASGSVTKAKKTVKRSHIPRIKAMPDFAKLHEKQFDKMDSLRDYLNKKRDRMEALTPGKALQAVRKSPRNFVKSVKEANFNFDKSSSSRSDKPFAFTAVKDSKVLANVSNTTKSFDLKASLSKPLGYKPYKGKVGPWNPSLKKEERIAMMKKQSNIKSSSKSMIKGVRLNKRAELLLKRRNLDK